MSKGKNWPACASAANEVPLHKLNLTSLSWQARQRKLDAGNSITDLAVVAAPAEVAAGGRVAAV
jgi:hypothetical protein